MDYPIIKNGEEIGTLSVTKEGLLTIFEGYAKDEGEFLRLSVYGDGIEGKLGLMQPVDGVLKLKKSLSAAAMRSFPRKITMVAPSGLRQQGMKKERQIKKVTEEKDDIEDVLWFSMSDGCLRTTVQDKTLIAMPIEQINFPRGAKYDLRVIEGVEYVVFMR